VSTQINKYLIELFGKPKYEPFKLPDDSSYIIMISTKPSKPSQFRHGDDLNVFANYKGQCYFGSTMWNRQHKAFIEGSLGIGITSLKRKLDIASELLTADDTQKYIPEYNNLLKSGKPLTNYHVGDTDWGAYHTTFAFFSIDSAKVKKTNNFLSLETIEVKKHIYQPYIPFKKIRTIFKPDEGVHMGGLELKFE